MTDNAAVGTRFNMSANSIKSMRKALRVLKEMGAAGGSIQTAATTAIGIADAEENDGSSQQDTYAEESEYAATSLSAAWVLESLLRHNSKVLRCLAYVTGESEVILFALILVFLCIWCSNLFGATRTLRGLGTIVGAFYPAVKTCNAIEHVCARKRK